MIRSLDDLSPSGRAAASGFLDAATAVVGSRLRGELREDLILHLCERLEPGASATAVEQVIADLGDLDESAVDAPLKDLLGRLIAGVDPRDLGGRLAASLWNPADERLLLPRALGWGWDLNFGALAVRLGLIEPDAEAVPFAATPPTAFRAAAAVPVGLAAALAVRYLVAARRLPDRLPSHWDLAGRPDRWVSRRRAVLTDLGVAGAAGAWAVAAVASSRPGPSRAGMLAGATLAAGIVTSTAIQRGRGQRGGPLTVPAGLAATLAGVGAVLFGLARAGRRAEIEHDLNKE